MNFLEEYNNYFNDYIINDYINLIKEDKSIGILDLTINDSKISIGGCDRKNYFKLKAIPPTNFGITEYEKLEYKYDKISTIIEKITKYLIIKNKNIKIIDPIEIKDIIILKHQENNYSLFNQNIKSVIDNENTIFLFDVIEYFNEFKQEEILIASRYLPGIIFLLKHTNAQVINLILKHGLKEKLIEFRKGLINEKEVLLINGKITNFELEKYYKLVLRNLEILNNNLITNKLPNKCHYDNCSNCYWKNLCYSLE